MKDRDNERVAVCSIWTIFVLMLSGCGTSQYALFNIQQKDAKAQCRACQATARKQEQATYCKSCAEMKAAHKAEQKRIAHQCDNLGEVVDIPPIQSGPNIGDVLPESGTFKGAGPQCKNGVCK